MSDDQHEDKIHVHVEEEVVVHEEVERVSVRAGDEPARQARRALMVHRAMLVAGAVVLLAFWIFLVRICFYFFTS